MPLLTMKDAMKLTGKSKTTIHRLTKDGTLSVAQKNKNGHNMYDPAELLRVFNETPDETKKDQQKTKEKNFMELLIEKQEQQITKLMEQNERLEERNTNLTNELISINKRLLEAPKAKKKLFGLF